MVSLSRPATPPAPIPDPAKGKEESEQRSQCRLAVAVPSVRSVSDPPAGPRSFRDCAREFRLPIHSIVCFEAGRFALTQSSWTTLTQRCSRKWMSGHAAYALVLTADRGQFTTQSFTRRENPSCQVVGNLCLSLDSYLSWMSRNIRSPGCPVGPRNTAIRHWRPLSKAASRKSENCHSITGTDLYDTLAVSRSC